MKLKKSIRTASGKIIPAGTTLNIGVEGFCQYKGETIFKKFIPKAAIESDDPTNNEFDSDKNFKDFESISAGDKGYDVNGRPITILGTGIGQTGYQALVDEFGNTDDMSFDDITNGYDAEEIKDLKFIAYTLDEDQTVHVSLYGAEFSAAVEAEERQAMPFDEVEPGDTGISTDGKAFKVYAKGTGKTWFENIKEANDLDDVAFPELPDGVEENSVDFVYGAFENGPKSIQMYGAAGVRVYAVEETED